MSIATLKKKTSAKYNNMSVGAKQFSLNGTHRNQGYVGQSVISRSLPRTLMCGSTVRGYGTKHGGYKGGHIIQSSLNYQEDSSVVKSSVINTNGMLINKYECIGKCIESANNCVNCINHINVVKPDTNHIKNHINVVKPDTNKHNNTQGDYISRKSKRNICDSAFFTGSGGRPYCDPKIAALLYTPKLCQFLTKSPQEIGIPMSQGDYIEKVINRRCPTFDAVPTSSNNNLPFACTGSLGSGTRCNYGSHYNKYCYINPN